MVTTNIIYAAVLALYIDVDGEESLIFTKRSNNVQHHRGQISFPGGMNEPGDESKLDTAIRECCEEIGVCKNKITILEQLEPIPNKSNDFNIFSFTGRIRANAIFTLNEEVDRLVFIPVEWLKHPKNLTSEIFMDSNKQRRRIYRFLPYDNEMVWGITASIVMKALKIKKAEE